MADVFEQHCLNLQNLCRICGGYIRKDPVMVNTIHERIAEAFHIDTSSDNPVVHPPKICLACYSTMINIKKRQTTTILKIWPWYEHSNDCMTCSHTLKVKKGGRKLKKPKLGRPKAGTKIWSRSIFDLLSEKSPIVDFDTNLAAFHFQREFNGHLELCICKICQKILKTPLILRQCEHVFCLKCIADKLQGKYENSTKCPVCSTPILISDLGHSKNSYNLLGCLKIQCSNHCGELFKVEETIRKKIMN